MVVVLLGAALDLGTRSVEQLAGADVDLGQTGVVLVAALYIVSALLELAGLALVVAGVLEDRRTARQLLSDLEAIDGRRTEDPILFTDLRGAQVDSEWAMTMHRRQLGLHAGELANAGRRQSIGVGLFAAGAVAGLAANLLSL